MGCWNKFWGKGLGIIFPFFNFWWVYCRDLTLHFGSFIITSRLTRAYWNPLRYCGTQLVSIFIKVLILVNSLKSQLIHHQEAIPSSDSTNLTHQRSYQQILRYELGTFWTSRDIVGRQSNKVQLYEPSKHLQTTAPCIMYRQYRGTYKRTYVAALRWMSWIVFESLKDESSF